MGKQLLRSGTSVGAHYRESIRGRSDAEVVSKLEGALQELEETNYWIELLDESGTVKSDALPELIHETDELAAILVTCVKKVKARSR
jgi:four helix bundle protein